MPYIFILYIYSVCRSVVSLSGACSVVTVGGMRGGYGGGSIPNLSRYAVNTETGEVCALRRALSAANSLLDESFILFGAVPLLGDVHAG